jgi:hypothetical protein
MTTFKKEAVTQLQKLARECLNRYRLDFYTLKSNRKDLIKAIKANKKAIVALDKELRTVPMRFSDPLYKLAISLPLSSGLADQRVQLRRNRLNLKKLDLNYKTLKEKFIEINALFDSLGFKVKEEA